jgi:hypothetical protein
MWYIICYVLAFVSGQVSTLGVVWILSKDAERRF